MCLPYKDLKDFSLISIKLLKGFKQLKTVPIMSQSESNYIPSSVGGTLLSLF